MNKINSDYIVVISSDYEKDTSYAQECMDNLREKGYNIWNYQGRITGYEVLDKIAEKIINCKAVVVFMSENLRKDSWQKKAIDLAKMEYRPVQLVFLDNYEFEKLPSEMQQHYSGADILKCSKKERIKEVEIKICDFVKNCEI